MRKQQLEDRRRRNQALAEQDARNRCSYCRIALVNVVIVEEFGSGRRFCSDDCVARADEQRVMAQRHP